MTRYFRTDAVSSHCQIAFASWVVPSVLAVVSSSSPSRSLNFVSAIAVKIKPLAVHQQALTALLAARSYHYISRRMGGRRRKSGDEGFGPPTGEF